MGQNNDTTERGDPQGHQGSQPKIPPAERKRQSAYPSTDGSRRRYPRTGGTADKPPGDNSG